MLHQIGVGALGPVFRTYEPTRDRLVAVKVFRLDITPEQAKALADELSRAADASLFHPSIVEPIAAGIEGTVAYRAEEYVAAESLDVAMRHYAPASVDKVLPFITQLAGAIDFARAAGIGHGALHPRDIFVTPDEARATGFGVVEALERVGLRAPVRRPYSAPERVEGGSWSTAADIFALAAIAYELLTGRRPAGTGDRIGTIGDHAHATQIHQVLARAMSERAADRYVTALSLASALEAAARGEPVTGAISTVAAIATAPIATGEPTLFTTEEPSEADRFTHVGDEPVLPTEDVRPPALAGVSEELIGEKPGERHAAGEILHEHSLESAVEPAGDADLIRATAEEQDVIREYPRESAAEEDVIRDHPRESAAEYPRESAAEEDVIRDYPRESAAERDVIRDYPRESAAEYPRVSAAEDTSESAAVERPRPAVLPIALTLILGLLIGFAAGYAVGGRDRGAQPAQSVAAPPPATTGDQQSAGRQWSEQAVKPSPTTSGARPPAAAPPVPADVPGRTAAGSASAARTGAAPEPETPAKPAPPTTGTLVVRSTPSGAGVTVNGRWRGRTPLTLERLPFARYVVRIVQPGFAVEREEIALSRANASRAISVRLRSPRVASAPARRGGAGSARETASSAALFGSLYIASNPAGARVFIDGKPVGTAPVRVPELRIGAHVVRMELPDHRTWTTGASVVAGQERRVTGSLERIR